MIKNLSLSTLLFISFTIYGQSQYFGQNKPRNKTNNFKVLQSPHFSLYYYNNKVSSDFLRNSEYWYKLHQEVFKLAFIKPNPIILYNSHPDFQETTAIGGEISEGTGGVTEGLRTRVVMPIMFTNRQTDHVLGHELVHAFQYQTMTYGSDSASLNHIQNIPLFMIEGLAEYMSLGRKDPNTAMWLRDAVQSEDIPTIKDLTLKPHKYFPYRWGQAFWAYVTSNYGDDIIRPLFKETAQYGLEQAFLRAFKMDSEAFSEKFKKDLVNYYTIQKNGKELEIRGNLIASEKNGSEMNISPSISPDGKYLAYVSSKNVLSLDIFITDAKTGKTIKKIQSSSFGGHVDSYGFIETSGTWSPDSRKFAIVIQTKSKNKLLLIDILNGEKIEASPQGIDAFTNPAWSPNGNSIVFTGLKEGISDLFLFNIKSKETTNLTNDKYSDIQATWSPDGENIFYVSDRGGNLERLEKEYYRISKLNLNSGKIETLKLFENEDNMNPAFSPDGKNLYFLSAPDGFRNIYKYNFAGSKITKLTNYFTGISGITMYSPALSVAYKTGEIAYNYFQKGDYNIVLANDTHFLNDSVPAIQNENAAFLAPGNIVSGADIVQTNLKKTGIPSKLANIKSKESNYKPNFKLEYLANSGLGMSTSRFGSGMGGGVTALFGDMLSNNQLMGTIATNGEIQDFGGQLFYINQKRPLQYGISVSHIPYRFYSNSNKDISFGDTLSYKPIGISQIQGTYFQNINRLFIDELTLFAFKPISRINRFEFNVSSNWYTLNQREQPIKGIFYVQNGNPIDFVATQFLRTKKLNDTSSIFNSFGYRQLQIAYVGDNTTFGTVAPLNGYRYRIELSKTFGTTSFNQVLIDFRKYKYLKPVSLAVRGFYQGRMNGQNLKNLNQIYPLNIGYPWYIHGFYGNSLYKQIGTSYSNDLNGDQIGLFNFEARLPLTGPKKLALIDFQSIPSDLNFFFDYGRIFSSTLVDIDESDLVSKQKINPKKPVLSTGISLRVNVLGYLIVEPYLAVPYFNGQKQAVITGFNFMVAGW